MSSKLLKSQLNTILHKRIDKQEQQPLGGKPGGKAKAKAGAGTRRAAKRARKQQQQQQAQPGDEERQTQVLASNLRYFSKTTEPSGAAAVLVAQALAAQGFQPRLRKAAAAAPQQQQQDDEWDDDLAEFGDLI